MISKTPSKLERVPSRYTWKHEGNNSTPWPASKPLSVSEAKRHQSTPPKLRLMYSG